MSIDKSQFVHSYFDRLKLLLDSVSVTQIIEVLEVFEDAYRRDAVVYICGNGGSWATAAHWVCDFSKGANHEGKRRFRMFALGDNVPMLTAYANDVNYNSVFAEPVKTYARNGDVVVLITASGNSPNVLEAAKAAREVGATTIGLIGFGGGKLRELSDHSITVDSREYGPVEDLHMILDHIISTFMREIIAAGA